MKQPLVLTLFCVFLTLQQNTAQTLKVMTYNIRLQLDADGANSWTNRKEFLTGQLKFYGPDIFGVQEALPVQVEDITRAFPDYNRAGTGRDGNGQGESSNIFYQLSRFTLKDSGTFWLSETPDRISKGWDAALNRVCTYVLLRDKKTRRQFWVFNTHLDHMGEMARRNSIDLILSSIAKKNTKGYPVVFMGDLNSTPETPQILQLKTNMQDARDISAMPAFGPEGTFNGFKYNEPATRRIDYIFVSHGVKVHRTAVLTDSRDLRFPSDHFPVFAEISF